MPFHNNSSQFVLNKQTQAWPSSKVLEWIFVECDNLTPHQNMEVHGNYIVSIM